MFRFALVFLLFTSLQAFAPLRPRPAGLARARRWLRATSDENATGVDAEAAADPAEGEAAEEEDAEAVRKMVKDLEASNKQLRNEIEKVENELAMAGENGYYTLMAQMENYRKQQGANQARLNDQALADVVRAFVPIVDDFNALPEALRAELAEAADAEGEVAKYINSYDTVGRQLWTTLQGKGVESFTASEGALLDPLRHEVVEDLGEDAEKGGTIQSCVQEGLQVGGAVVRKARVSAFSAPAPEEPAAEEEAAAEAEAAGEGDADAEEAA